MCMIIFDKTGSYDEIQMVSILMKKIKKPNNFYQILQNRDKLLVYIITTERHTNGPVAHHSRI